MAGHWEQIRKLVAEALERGRVEAIGQVASVLTHFSHVFEGALPERDRLRVQMAACVQDQPATVVGVDVTWFEKIEDRGFLLLSTHDFAGLEQIVGDDAFEEHEAKIAESIRSQRALNDNDRIAREALTTLHRLRADQPAHREDFVAADDQFAVAAVTASGARNESLEIAILLDRVRMRWTSPLRSARGRIISEHLSAPTPSPGRRLFPIDVDSSTSTFFAQSSSSPRIDSTRRQSSSTRPSTSGVTPRSKAKSWFASKTAWRESPNSVLDRQKRHDRQWRLFFEPCDDSTQRHDLLPERVYGERAPRIPPCHPAGEYEIDGCSSGTVFQVTGERSP
jgi:hypothetical protein